MELCGHTLCLASSQHARGPRSSPISGHTSGICMPPSHALGVQEPAPWRDALASLLAAVGAAVLLL